MAKVKAQKTFRGRSGTLITPEIADELAAEAEGGYDLSKAVLQPVGRPSLGQAGTSPRLNFRVCPETFTAAKRRAEEEGRSVSDLAREALESFLDS
jgi:DNA topoisomerase IB